MEIKKGFCQCGCEKPVPQYTRNRPHIGVQKGDPHKVLRGHWFGTPEERFWSKVAKKGIEECWNWKGANGSWGGRFLYEGRQINPAKFSYEIHIGTISPNMQINHHCDNPLCVNPKHLFIGTQSDNMVDCIEKGRHWSQTKRDETIAKISASRKGIRVHRGEESPQSKLTEKKVREIRLWSKYGRSQPQIAEKFGVARTTINAILNGYNWKHVK